MLEIVYCPSSHSIIFKVRIATGPLNVLITVHSKLACICSLTASGHFKYRKLFIF